MGTKYITVTLHPHPDHWTCHVAVWQTINRNPWRRLIWEPWRHVILLDRDLEAEEVALAVERAVKALAQSPDSSVP